MTASTDHAGLEVLTRAQCIDLMSTEPVGRIAFVDAGEPVVLPVNFAIGDGQIVFRSTYGSKVSAALRAATVAFEVDSYDPGVRAGWSVIATGVAEVVESEDEIAELEELGLQPWADAVEKPIWVRITPDQISGRKT